MKLFSLKKESFKYLDIITALFVTILIVSNITSSKILDLGPFTFDGGTILFPLSYILGDILTEVYGYKNSRRVIWIGFFCLSLTVISLYTVQLLPPNAEWGSQSSYETILGIVPRIVLGSFLGYFCGGFSNAFVMAKMKIWSKGKHLWKRTIGSTLVGEAFDTLVFALVAFTGVLPTDILVTVILSNYIFKVGIEVIFTPITYTVVDYLKEKEKVDIYDKKTKFTPFHF